MSSARHLHGLSGWGKSKFHTHGYWTLDQVVPTTEWVISTSSLQWPKCEFCMVWWANRTSWRRWYTGFQSVVRTIWSGFRSMETLWCQMVRMNNNYQGSENKVCLLKHSTNTISPTDAKWANGWENKMQLMCRRVLVGVWFNLVLDDYCNEYEIKSMENRYLVNRIIAWFGWTNMWWKAGESI